MSYPIENHKLEFTTDFSQVIVLETESCTVVNNYPLSDEVHIHIENGDFILQANVSLDGHLDKFSQNPEDELHFDGQRLIGVTDVRVDAFRIRHTYHLDQCPIVVKKVENRIAVTSPCGSERTAPLPNCCTVTPLVEQAV